jgi:copper resistance protein D
MIIEYLRPDANIWDGLDVVFKAAYYITSLGAAGLAMFSLGFRHRLPQREAVALDNLIVGIVAATMAASIISGFVRVHVLSAGDVSNIGVWASMLRSRLGDAFLVRQLGLLLILLPLVYRIGFHQAVSGGGILLVLLSYAMMGHSTIYVPRQELAVSVVIHMAAVAFWAGSLIPLSRAAQRGDAAAAALVRDWSKIALICVSALIVTGLIAGALLLRTPSNLLTSWYGNAMIAKLILFCVTVGFAALHKLRLSEQLYAGNGLAGQRLSRSIMIEGIVMLLVFYAAAEMVSHHPPDMGHRLQG